MKSILKRNRVLAVIALIGLLASLVPLISRVQAEESNKYYDIVLDYNSMRSMARATTALKITAPTAVEDGAVFSARPSSCKAESPRQPQLSMTISAKSTIFLPDECREGTVVEVCMLVSAITVMPRACAARAISMVTALRPETE